MTKEDEEFNRIEREATMKKRKYDDDDIQDYVRPWVGLTDREVDDLSREMVKRNKSVNWLSYSIEAKLKEKNNAS